MRGALDLMMLQTLAALGPQHGYAIGARIEQRRRCGTSRGTPRVPRNSEEEAGSAGLVKTYGV